MTKRIDYTEEPFVCTACGKKLLDIHYIRSISPLYAKIGHLPVCKECLKQQYTRYVVRFNDPRKAAIRFCSAFDLPFADKMVIEGGDPNVFLSTFTRLLNLPQYKNKTFDDSMVEGNLFQENKNELVENLFEDERKTKNKLIDKWGEGLEFIDYSELEKHYRYLKSANPNCDSNQEIFIIDLCYLKMQQLKAVRNGDSDTYKKLSDAYRQTFKDAGLQATKDTSSNDTFSIGTSIEMIERYTPAEYYKDKKLYKDFDGLSEYIERFMMRPLRNLMHGSNDRDKEFFVPDEDNENDGFDEE